LLVLFFLLFVITFRSTCIVIQLLCNCWLFLFSLLIEFLFLLMSFFRLFFFYVVTHNALMYRLVFFFQYIENIKGKARKGRRNFWILNFWKEWWIQNLIISWIRFYHKRCGPNIISSPMHELYLLNEICYSSKPK
jgi:hypothetical protein